MEYGSQLSPALAGKYQVVGIEPGEVQTRRHGRIDLRTLDVETAAQLVAQGCSYLVALQEPAPSPLSVPEVPRLNAKPPRRPRVKA